VDWETLLPQGRGAAVRHLSTRGKNILFVQLVCEALGADNIDPGDLAGVKRLFSPAAVTRIHEAVQFVWPDAVDLQRVLKQEARLTSGLYIGDYNNPEAVIRGVTRHSLYADRILLVDPLLHPARVRDDLNPLLHPAMHRGSTLKWIALWFALVPWIDEGLIGFVRSPSDFDLELTTVAHEISRRRFQSHPELQQLVDDEREKQSELYSAYLEHLTLLTPDRRLREIIRETNPGITVDGVDRAVADIQHRRDASPLYFPPAEESGSHEDMLHMSTGTSYELAKSIARHTGSHLMTDLRFRWREMEVDRIDAGYSSADWEPFAKAFHNLQFHYLNAVPLSAALALRRQNRLSGMRNFLRKTWRESALTPLMSQQNSEILAEELEEHARAAEAEWKSIDRDLLKMVTERTVAGLAAAGPLIAAGHAGWLGALTAIGGLGTIAQGSMRRREFRLSHPAGFFVDLRRGVYK
jgi:hypothetical protein